MKNYISISELRNSYNSVSVKDNSIRGIETKNVNQVEVGDFVLINNEFVEVVIEAVIDLESEKSKIESQIDDISSDFANDYDAYSSEYLEDAITSYADGQVDIYNDDLIEWAKDNYEYIEMANEEYGCDNTDFWYMIQRGEFYQNETNIHNDIEEIIEVIIIDYLINEHDIHEMTEYQYESLLNSIDSYDIDMLSDIADLVDNKLVELEIIEEA